MAQHGAAHPLTVRTLWMPQYLDPSTLKTPHFVPFCASPIHRSFVPLPSPCSLPGAAQTLATVAVQLCPLLTSLLFCLLQHHPYVCVPPLSLLCAQRNANNPLVHPRTSPAPSSRRRAPNPNAAPLPSYTRSLPPPPSIGPLCCLSSVFFCSSPSKLGVWSPTSFLPLLRQL